jgi:hypothetical protein
MLSIDFDKERVEIILNLDKNGEIALFFLYEMKLHENVSLSFVLLKKMICDLRRSDLFAERSTVDDIVPGEMELISAVRLVS